jgi:thiosulfate reductase cytochrome b subunit
MSKIYLYPLWLRTWHWLNALCFLILIMTGLSMHYSGTFLQVFSFEYARLFHNSSGILLSVNYLLFVFGNIFSGNYKQYIPTLGGLMAKVVKQMKYYLYGVFQNHEHPFETTQEEKFNPLQKLTYLFIMYLFMPLVILSGLVLFFPEKAPEKVLGLGGIWPIAIFHIAIGYVLSFFMFAHIYLATHGKTVSSNFKGMITGFHE